MSGHIGVSVGFHIDGIDDISGDKSDFSKIRRTLGWCQDHEVLRQKVIENTRHHLLALISKMEPLGYGSNMSVHDDGRTSPKAPSLNDLERLFSEDVESIFGKYGIVVDNVTITESRIDPEYVKRAEAVQNARLEARQKVLVAEQQREQELIEQQKALQRAQAQTRQQTELSKQREIERQREIDDTAAKAKAEASAAAERLEVEKAAELKRQEMEAESRVRQQELKLQEMEKAKEATEREMELRKYTAEKQAETRAVETTAEKLAEAQARRTVAECDLEATRLEVEARKLKSEGAKAEGLAATTVERHREYGDMSSQQILDLLKTRAGTEAIKELAVASLKSGTPVNGLTQLALDPTALAQLGQVEMVRSMVPTAVVAGGIFSTGVPQSREAGSAAEHDAHVRVVEQSKIPPH